MAGRHGPVARFSQISPYIIPFLLASTNNALLLLFGLELSTQSVFFNPYKISFLNEVILENVD